MKQSLFTLEHARQLTADTYELVLSGDTSAITAPGQFVNIQLPGKFLRRPISICNWTKDALLLLVRVVGEGTHDLVRCVPGTELDVLSGLGNGFDLAKGGAHPILLGGGIALAEALGRELKAKVSVFKTFGTAMVRARNVEVEFHIQANLFQQRRDFFFF